ncbi:MAG TPA: CPBP family intramembrane glutamic endopeptidase [Myxococcales bacterium]|nr:CPBP family intramembrane glutamic endopeptidase [Myxococcales bacterium]
MEPAKPMTAAELYGAASPFRELPTFAPAGALARQLGTYVASGLVVVLLARAVNGSVPTARFAFTIGDFALGLAGVVAYAGYNALFATVLRFSRAGNTLLGWMGRRNSTLFGKLPLSTMFVMAALAGPCEELIFRGWLQPVAGLWIASLVFAVLHFLPNRYKWSHPVTWGMVALYFPVGLAVGWLYEWRGNLLGPMVMHSLSDSLGLLLLARALAARARARSTSPSPF